MQASPPRMRDACSGVSSRGGARQRIDRVVVARRAQMIQVVAPGENAAIAPARPIRPATPGRARTGSRCPGARSGCRISSQPTMVLPCFVRDPMDALVEIQLEGERVRQPVLFGEGLHAAATVLHCLPLTSSPPMWKIGVGKQRGHLAEKCRRETGRSLRGWGPSPDRRRRSGGRSRKGPGALARSG